MENNKNEKTILDYGDDNLEYVKLWANTYFPDLPPIELNIPEIDAQRRIADINDDTGDHLAGIFPEYSDLSADVPDQHDQEKNHHLLK